MESGKIIIFLSLLRRITANASEIACSSALKMLALFGSLIILVVWPSSINYRCRYSVPHHRAICVQ